MIPAVVYAAKSTEDRHSSIPDQLADCGTMAEREGWTVVGELSDEGFSAFKQSRGPGLEEAKRRAAEAAAEHGQAVLVAQHSDRLARGAGDAPGAADHLGEVFFAMRRQGVALRSVQDDANLMKPLLAAMIGERNTEDSRRKSEAVKDGARRRAERGRHHGGPRPYRYEYVDGRLEPVAAEAAVIRGMFTEAVAGKSIRAITRDLTRDGIRPQRGTRWSGATALVGGGHLIDPASPEVIAFIEEVLESR